MNGIAVANRAADWRRLKALVLDSVSSPITKRVYNLGLDEFFAWYELEPRPGFTKATVSAWRVALEARGLGSVSINVRITAVRKLAVEAADNGLLAPELAAGITRVKGAKSKGVRVGNWLSVQQAQKLLNTPDITTKKGLRDRAMLAVLLGCGLRRSEVAALTLKHIQQRDNRWCIVDLVGKHGRVRTIPMPTWVKVAIVVSEAFDTTACNVNQDQSTDITDVRTMINEALGILAPANDLNKDSVVNVVDLLIVMDAALGQGCSAKQ
jgi:site-specific recombinase XerD